MTRIVRTTLNELKPLSAKRLRELKKLSERPDEEIDYSDIPPLDEKFWQNARPGREVFEERRLARERRVTVELDPEVLAWLKGNEQKVNPARVSEVLRDAMEHDLLKKSA